MYRYIQLPGCNYHGIANGLLRVSIILPSKTKPQVIKPGASLLLFIEKGFETMKTTMQMILLILTVVLLIACPAEAQKDGSTSMQYLKVIPGARAAAMGNAYVAIAQGAEGVFWNPAGVAFTERQEFSTTYIDWLFDSKQYALAYAMSLGNIGAIGIQLQYVDYGGFEEANVSSGINLYPGQSLPYLTGRTFHPYSYVAGLSYAKSLTDRFATGLSIKFTHESLYYKNQVSVKASESTEKNVNTFANVILFDLGVFFNTGFRTTKIGASVQNFGADIKYVEDKSTVPLLFRVGIAADLIGENALLVENKINRLGIAFDIFQSNDSDQQQHIGAEYEFVNTLVLRTGYKLNYELEGMTFGFGIKQRIKNIKFSIDYSFGAIGAVAGTFGNVHRISIGVGSI
jgi:hypothetical protein